MIIDFHPHAFPDSVAAKAIPSLEKTGRLLVVHCEYDIAYPRIRQADPVGIHSQ